MKKQNSKSEEEREADQIHYLQKWNEGGSQEGFKSLARFDNKNENALLQQSPHLLHHHSSQMNLDMEGMIRETRKPDTDRLDYLKDIFLDKDLGFAFYETEKSETDEISVPIDYEKVNRSLNLVKKQMFVTDFSSKKGEGSSKKSNAVAVTQQSSSSTAATNNNPQAGQNQTTTTTNPIISREPPSTKVTITEVKPRLQSINPNFPLEETQLMFPPNQEVNSKELFELLKPNKVKTDPLMEAIKLFMDPQTGEFKQTHLNKVLNKLGHSSLALRDFSILKDIMDIDQDGKVTAEDLCEVLSSSNDIYYENKKPKYPI